MFVNTSKTAFQVPQTKQDPTAPLAPVAVIKSHYSLPVTDYQKPLTFPKLPRQNAASS